MVNKKEALDIMEDVITVFHKETEAVDTNNGILNDHYLQFQKNRIFKQNTKHLINEVVKTKQHYPNNDVSEVDMKMDFVVMSGDDFDKLKQYIENE